MKLEDFSDRINNEGPHVDGHAQFNFISEHLSKFFELAHKGIRHPYAVVVGVESILQSKELAKPSSFAALTGCQGLSQMQSYCNEALYNYETGHAGVWTPLWILEGDALRRWSPHRRKAYTFHEAFWMTFLARYCDAGKNRVELLTLETLDVHNSKPDLANRQVDPERLFSQVVYDALAGTHLDKYGAFPLDSFMLDLSQSVLARIGR